MRIIVLSDSHNHGDILEDAIQKNLKQADLFLFLGDGAKDYNRITQKYQNKMFVAVRGNCDTEENLPLERVINVQDKKILMSHGHTYDVKYGYFFLVKKARAIGAHIALYGHTHIAFSEYVNGVYLMNPGSVSSPRTGARSFGMIDIIDDAVITQIIEIKN